MNGIGNPPYFVEKPNGELAGFELDTIRVMAKKVNANIKVKPSHTWFDVATDSNGTMLLDDVGYPIFIGPVPEVYYHRATFVVAEHFYQEFAYEMYEFLITSTQTFYYRTPKPQVAFRVYPHLLHKH